MKKMISLLSIMLTAVPAFCQQKLHDGIYLVAQFAKNAPVNLQPNQAIVPYGAGFVNEDPENYNTLVIITEHFFSFDMAGQPIIQHDNKDNGLLLLQLTSNAREKLNNFTSSNMMKEVAVVINNEAVVLYKITAPVTGGLIKIARCKGQACSQLAKNLGTKGKARAAIKNR